jgi:MFS family permease
LRRTGATMSETTDGTPRRPGRTVAMAAAMQAIGGGLGWSLLPALMPKIAVELGLSHTMGGVVWGAAPLGIALAAPLGGTAADRFGPRRTAGFAMFAGALACMARAWADGPWTLAAAMFLFGLHIGFVAPSLPKALAAHVDLSRLGRANGIALLSYTLATAAVVLTARPYLEPFFGGWRPLTGVAAFAMAITGAAWLFVIDDRVALAKHARLSAVLALAKDAQVRRVAAMQFLLFGGYLAMLGLLPRALTEAGVAPQQIGVTVAAWLVAAATANYLGPVISDRMGLRRPVFLVGAAVAGLSLLALAVAPAELRVPLLVLAALGGGSFAPLLMTMPLELPQVGPARAGAGLGFLMLVGQAGGALLPMLSGAAAERGGFAGAIALLGLLHLAIMIPAFGVMETGRRAPVPAPVPAAVG